MRFCYVISRHARGNMAAAGVVSGKVSNGPGWRGGSWPDGLRLLGGRRGGGKAGRVGVRAGRPACDCDRAGRGVSCSARVLDEPRVRQFLLPGLAGLRAAVPLCPGAQRGDFSSDHPLGGQLDPCVPPPPPAGDSSFSVASLL